MRVVFVGSSGGGKSSTINSLLGWKACEVGDGPSSVTRETQTVSTNIFGVPSVVVDTVSEGSRSLHKYYEHEKKHSVIVYVVRSGRQTLMTLNDIRRIIRISKDVPIIVVITERKGIHSTDPMPEEIFPHRSPIINVSNRSSDNIHQLYIAIKSATINTLSKPIESPIQQYGKVILQHVTSGLYLAMSRGNTGIYASLSSIPIVFNIIPIKTSSVYCQYRTEYILEDSTTNYVLYESLSGYPSITQRVGGQTEQRWIITPSPSHDIVDTPNTILESTNIIYLYNARWENYLYVNTSQQTNIYWTQCGPSPDAWKIIVR